jgi:hypothetical protein
MTSQAHEVNHWNFYYPAEVCTNRARSILLAFWRIEFHFTSFAKSPANAIMIYEKQLIIPERLFGVFQR